MKERLDNFLKKLGRTPCDVAAGPMLLMVFGVPVLLAIAAIAICFFAVRAIIRINQKKKAEKGEE